MQSNVGSVVIRKGTSSTVKFKIYRDVIKRTPINLTNYNEFICAVTENGRLLIEKKYSKNEVYCISDVENVAPYILTVQFVKEDTENMTLNPRDEERQRTLEIFGITCNNEVVCFLATNFNLEGSGYYVRRDRA